MQKSSKEDALVRLRRIVEELQDEKKAVGIFFDITGAFDIVRWPLALQDLKERGCPAKCLWSAQQLLHG